jgi:hypothetical protein
MGRQSEIQLPLFLDPCRIRKARRHLYKVLKFGQLMQLGLLFVIFLLVLQSHSRASRATEQLLLFKEEESMLLLQLQKIEKQSLTLHENIRTRMKRAGIYATKVGEQTSELYEMTQELNGQVETVQARIEQSGRDHIIQEYGEGPVKVVLELEFLEHTNTAGGLKKNNQKKKKATPYSNFFQTQDNNRSYITILLWPETPHAAWTWLEQIGRHVWDGASFRSNSNEPLLELAPIKQDPLHRGQLQFEEFHDTPHWHSAWSVGVRNSEEGGLQMTLNLSDNTESKDTCIGRIVDGYDALQRLFESTVNSNGDFTAARVKRVSAMHMTHMELSNVDF